MAKYSNVTNGQQEAVLNKLGGVAGMEAFLAGRSEVVMNKHIIDCNADPFVPAHLDLVDHRRNGTFHIVPQEIRRVVYCLQSGGAGGRQIKTYLNGVPGLLLNANVLDYLLADTKIIPQYLKDLIDGYQPALCFWGTEYRHNRRPCIRGLRWNQHSGAWDSTLVYTDMLVHNWELAAMY